MRAVFADTSYYIALLNPKDDQHAASRGFTARLATPIVTTAWVLTEVANTLSNPNRRHAVVRLLRLLEADSSATIIPASQDLFDRGVALYADRPDQRWSLTDCISFVVMEDRELREALTADHHFEQAGFVALLKSNSP